MYTISDSSCIGINKQFNITLVVDTVSFYVGALCIHVVSVLVYTSDFASLTLSKDADLDNWRA